MTKTKQNKNDPFFMISYDSHAFKTLEEALLDASEGDTILEVKVKNRYEVNYKPQAVKL